MRKILLFSLLSGVCIGAGIAAVSEGAFFNGWLAAGGLSAAAIFGLCLAWRWAGGGRRLALLLAVSFALRLGIGIVMSLGLQTFGYDEVVQRSGYVYADAFSRDQDAWKLAASGDPLWASFQQQFLSDQYGGSLSLSALVYRAVSPDAHRRFLILILTAFAFSLGLPFLWKAVKERWNEPLALLAGWLLVLYPESVLVGASQMREPFLLGLTMIAFWAVFAWRRQRLAASAPPWGVVARASNTRRGAEGGQRLVAPEGGQRVRALVIFLAASLLMLAFSSRAAIVVIAALLVCAWVEYFDAIASRRWKWLGWGAVILGGVIFVGLSWSWLKLATSYDAGLSVRQSGMVQNIVGQLGPEFEVPFVTVYGLVQPVLPAALLDPAPFVWQAIGILRAAGWYLLAPFLLYAIFTAWRAPSEKDRRMLIWFGLSALLWLVLSSARAGGDQWDNPRYRVLFLPFMALVTAWGWRWSREHQDAWIWAWVGADFVFVTFFMSWYLSRYTGAFGKLPFWLIVGLILAISAVLLALGWWWNLRRQGKSLRSEGRAYGLRLRQFLTLQPTATVETAPPALAPAKAGRINRWDVLIALVFLGFSLLYFLGRLQTNYPILILSGDAGNITSFAAAQAQPDLFRGDPALGEANLTGYYAAVQIPIIKALAPLAGGDYAWAYTWLVAPHILLQLLGFYILGRLLLRSRFWAVLLAFLTAMPFLDVGLGEFWGIWRDALPRITFQTALPFLLALVVLWRSQPRRWPWLMILAGLMVYLHSISTPAIGMAIWLGLWLYQPRDWKWPRRVGVMLGLGALFLLPIIPFALNFLSYQSRGASPDANLVMQVIQTYLPANILNVPAALGQFLWAATRSLLLPLALIGAVVLWRFGRADRRLVGMVLLWGAGIFLAAIVVPLGERLVENALHIPPVDTELMRAIRYFVPWMLLFWLWPLAELAPRFANRQAGQAAMLLGIVLLGGWTATHTPEGRRMLEAATCLAHGKLVCGEPRDSAGLITALRSQTPPGSKIFNFNVDDASTSNALSIRYDALRPMVYTVRDAGLFIYTNRTALRGWLEITRRVDAIQTLKTPAERLDRLVPLAKELKADYLAVDFPLTPADLAAYPVDLVWQNKLYTLVSLRTRP